MIRKCKYLYVLEKNFCWDASHIIDRSVNFCSDWLLVENGLITVKKGYAWDGCSYKFTLMDLWVIGTPDGRMKYGKPITYHASLVHDALTQYKDDIGIRHQDATAIFSALLKEVKFFWRPVYVTMIKIFGNKDFKGNTKHE